MKIPKDVVDKKAYIKYVNLSKKSIVNEGKDFEASDGTPINLGWFPHYMRKKIEHLPLDEQGDILDKKAEYSVVNNNMTVQKRLAFGLKQGRGVQNSDVKSLLDTRTSEIIDLFGRMFTPEEVLKTINKDWGIQFKSLNKIKEFRAKHSKEIEEQVDKFKASYTDIRLGTKRSRLEELTWMFSKQKQKYEDTGSDGSATLLLRMLEQIRKESEGDRLTIEGKIDVKYEVDLQNHLRDEIFRTLNLKEIILARVAARMGISPIKLIHSLNASYYKKFSNVLGDFDPEDSSGDIVYPSQLSYDFERIGKAQKQLDRNVQDVEFEEIEKDKERLNPERAQDIKERMLKKLAAKKGKISKAKVNKGNMGKK